MGDIFCPHTILPRGKKEVLIDESQRHVESVCKNQFDFSGLELSVVFKEDLILPDPAYSEA